MYYAMGACVGRRGSEYKREHVLGNVVQSTNMSMCWATWFRHEHVLGDVVQSTNVSKSWNLSSRIRQFQFC